MAFIDDHGPGNESYFNVSHAVGNRSANFWTDIMLVQYFIRNIYSWATMSGHPAFRNISDLIEYLPDPNKDFRDLEKTKNWIKRFQRDLSLAGVPLAQDGRVSRGKAISSEIYFTIHSLNSTYRNFVVMWSEEDVDWEGRLLNDPDLPPMLKGELTPH